MTILICQNSDGNVTVYRTAARNVISDMFPVLSDLLPTNVVAVGESPQADQFPDADVALLNGLILAYQNPNRALPAEARDLRYLLPSYNPHTPLIAALLDLCRFEERKTTTVTDPTPAAE